ncbi:sigma-70 family RNA polymerase sigma factor [Rhizobium alvei]|uniref:Sigma-70 family RNA polymerase sigma factor n=2 Tax=Rhizobium alvei TaxID=1132659 RepID=A0ABT8YQ43_9HYPH|nr:sigma-70 family RNA polymerase sigma factor [Rhizobium alvei]MDO6965631.1 sigma-70 family RNA polymerase sigma factor [Rhizobium alvei]
MQELPHLLGRIALGDRNAFSQLYQATSGKLFSILLRMLKSRADAEEALQEVYIRIWRNAGRYNEEAGSAMAWLCSIARYHAIDQLRARKPQTETLDEAFDLASLDPSPEENAQRRSVASGIENCMQTLEASRADAVRRAYVEGLSYLELANLHGVPLNTMRTWLRRSLLKLRECLGS